MTVAGWICYIIITLLILGIGYSISFSLFWDKKFIPILIAIILDIIILGMMLWWFNNTAAGKRALKTQESNFNDGIERTIIVYSVDGEPIKIYQGKFDIVYDNDRILFDDEKGKRHIIYYPTGTVLIDEDK